jgi:hypothetical protein
MTFAEAAGWPHLPIQERVADKLGDILYASDELLDMLRCGRAEHAPDATLYDVERLVSSVYHQINEVMKRMTD